MAGFERMPNLVWSKLEITEGLKKKTGFQKRPLIWNLLQTNKTKAERCLETFA